MSDEIEELDALAVLLVKMAVDSVRAIHPVADRARPHVVRALWRTPPRVVTWKEVRTSYVAWMRELAEETVRRDVAEGRVHGESTISPETARRLATLELHSGALDNLVGASLLDDLVFENGTPERLRLGELLTRSASLLFGLARMTHDAPYSALRAGRAIVLGRALLEYLGDVHLLLVRIDWATEAEAVVGMERALRPVVERLQTAEDRLVDVIRERGVPADPPGSERTAASDEARNDDDSHDEQADEIQPPEELSPQTSMQQLARIAAEVRRVAPRVADIVMRELYPHGAPRVVSLVDLANALDARLGTELPAQALESIAECDALVCPDDPDAPLSVHELFERIASAIEGAHERLLQDDEETRGELAFSVLLRARLLALQIAGAAQMLGHPTTVAPLAAVVGLHPAPGIAPVGSA